MENTPNPVRAHKADKKAPVKPLAIAAVAVVGLATSFMGGVQYQKGHTTTPSTQGQTAMNGRQGFGGGGMRMSRGNVFGEVTAVSSTSITVQEHMMMNGAAAEPIALTIAADTTVTNNGATASVSDIKTGDTVMVAKTSTDSTTAKSIELNPTLNGPSTNSSDSTLDTTTN